MHHIKSCDIKVNDNPKLDEICIPYEGLEAKIEGEFIIDVLFKDDYICTNNYNKQIDDSNIDEYDIVLYI